MIILFFFFEKKEEILISQSYFILCHLNTNWYGPNCLLLYQPRKNYNYNTALTG